MCLFHKWSKWKIIKTGQVYNNIDGKLSIIPSHDYVIQSKTCDKCGLTKFKEYSA